MQLYTAFNRIAPGEIVCFESDDPASWRDVHQMCDFLHHKILESRREEDGSFVLHIRKRTKQT